MISEVPYEQVLEIRRIVMYPEKDIEDVKLADDHQAIHIGYIAKGMPVSIISLFLQNNELQFRKFATLVQHQNNGYGTKIMDWLIDYANEMKFKRIWCNARSTKTDFYKKFGFEETNDTFYRGGIEYVVMEKNLN